MSQDKVSRDLEYDADTETTQSVDGQYKLTYTRELVGHDFSTFTWSGGEAHLQTEWVPLGGTYQRDITLKSLAFSDDGQNFDDMDALTDVLGIIARLLAVPRVSKVNVDRPDNHVRISLRAKNIQKLVPSEKIDQTIVTKVNASMSQQKVKIATSADGYPYWTPLLPIVAFCLERDGQFADKNATITKPFFEDKNGASYCRMVGPITVQDILDNFELPDHFEVSSPYANCISDSKNRSEISFTSVEKYENQERDRVERKMKSEKRRAARRLKLKEQNTPDANSVKE